MNWLLAILCCLAYAGGSLLVWRKMTNSDSNEHPSLARILVLAALILHAVLLFRPLTEGNHLNLAFYHAVSLEAWALALLLFIASLLKPLHSLGVIVYPMAALSMLAGVSLQSGQNPLETLSWQTGLHAGLAILAYAIITLASLQALLLALLANALRHPSRLHLARLMPPLEAMETLLFQMISTGFALLSLTLLSGILFVEDLLAQHLVHKTVLSVLAWLVFGTLLFGHFQFGWRGKKAVRMTLTGALLLLLAYFGSKFVLELVLAGG